MAILNRTTLKQKLSDFINRVSPFTDPLIQKPEDLEVREDLADSVIFKEATTGSISAPGANFTLDFDSNDEYNITTTASIPASFSISLSNLRNNAIGKINITKKTGDVFTFDNGQIVPFDVTNGQIGKTTIAFNIYKIGSLYFVQPLYNTNGTPLFTKIIDIGTWNMGSDASVNVNIGVNFSKVRTIDVIINSDISNGPLRQLSRAGFIEGTANTNSVTLERVASGVFQDVDYSSTSVNRGYIYIQHI